MVEVNSILRGLEGTDEVNKIKKKNEKTRGQDLKLC